MKTANKFVKMLLASSIALTMIGCSTSSAPDITPEQVLEVLSEYASEITPLVSGTNTTSELLFDQDGYALQLYTFTPSAIGTYEFSFNGYEKYKGLNLCMEVVDDYSNILLDLYNSKDRNTGCIDLNAGTNCYVAIYAEMTKKNKTVEPCRLNIEIQKVSDDISCDLLDKELIRTVSTNTYYTAYTEPEKDGYYEISINADSDYGEASVYGIIQGDDVIYEEEGICWMEAGNRYYIIYGVEDADSDQVDIELQCTLIEQASAEAATTILTNTLLTYKAAKDEDILVYSVSDADPSVRIYNEDFDLISQNNDYTGPYSTNKADFAALFHAENAKSYYIYISGINNESCDIHFESYE